MLVFRIFTMTNNKVRKNLDHFMREYLSSKQNIYLCYALWGLLVLIASSGFKDIFDFGVAFVTLLSLALVYMGISTIKDRTIALRSIIISGRKTIPIGYFSLTLSLVAIIIVFLLSRG